jgi:succinate dehydrogenase/fumarate reductase-like Fe-S protein
LEEIFREYSRVEAGVLLHAVGYDLDFDSRGTTVLEALEQIREQIKNLGGSKGA